MSTKRSHTSRLFQHTGLHWRRAISLAAVINFQFSFMPLKCYQVTWNLWTEAQALRHFFPLQYLSGDSTTGFKLDSQIFDTSVCEDLSKEYLNHHKCKNADAQIHTNFEMRYKYTETCRAPKQIISLAGLDYIEGHKCTLSCPWLRLNYNRVWGCILRK